LGRDVARRNVGGEMRLSRLDVYASSVTRSPCVATCSGRGMVRGRFFRARRSSATAHRRRSRGGPRQAGCA